MTTIATRNVNGIRAIAKKWLADWIEHHDLDIICLQETKAFEHQIPSDLQKLSYDYDYVWHAGSRPWYAGTAIFYKKTFWPSCANNFEGYDMLSEDGRITQFCQDDLIVLNGYFPNWGTRADGTEMLSYKLKFYDEIITYVQDLQAQWYTVITTGDFNIVHTERDIARPEANADSIGFKRVERAKIGSFMDKTNSLDMRRHLHPDTIDHYTRWSYRGWARYRNVGRRIDYFMVQEDLESSIISCEHLDEVMWSDHCPIVLELSD